ncbi:uncharacterized protein LTR77_002602 [Saxophila tyrrhenica]|uniref:Calcineurin-like phosphoesterase domain-containing protein n=1 Tax=Saxophila tyrrhenica TaxID=1690608 RepID=A0AAV9PNR4_9PEZI|nr:hypothetical protein LTR77_002602 [Saxophila tyrrhenica]
MTSKPNRVRIVCISDTHDKAPGEGYTLPAGDVLVHAGDLTNEGTYNELKRAAEWLEKADFAVKIVVAGVLHAFNQLENKVLADVVCHPSNNASETKDIERQRCRELTSSIPRATYLEHSSAVIHLPDKDVNFRIFGSPYSPLRPESGPFTAFQYRDAEAEALWNATLTDTDVLITHTPPAGICDTSQHFPDGGCPTLKKALGMVKPALHICGHCHEGRGAQVVRWDDADEVEWVKEWEDPGAGSKKMSLLDLTGKKGGTWLERGRETAVVNAAMVSRDRETGKRRIGKPIVVDVAL